MAVGDVFRIQVFQNVGSELTMNVLHARCTVSETTNVVDEADGLAEMAMATYNALKVELSEDWRVTNIVVHKLTAPGGVPANFVLGAGESIIGSIESEIIPSASAVLLSHYTSTADRSGRGRTYLPGLPESSQNEGQLVEARWAAFRTIANTAFVGEKKDVTSEVLKAIIDKAEYHGGEFEIEGAGQKWTVTVVAHGIKGDA